jgi:HAD superfamily hydrolase (TIGR01509 family)
MIQNLLLDVGGVLIHLHYERALRRLRSYAPQGEAEKIGPWVFGDDDRDKRDLNNGLISPQEFLERFKTRSGLDIPFEEFADIYCDVWSENSPLVDYLLTLRDELRIFFLTNADPIHVPRVFEECPRLQFCDGWVASYQVGCSKPDREFFLRSMALLHIEVEESVFVDDVLANVEGARAVGLTSFQYIHPEQLKRDLEGILSLRHADPI